MNDTSKPQLPASVETSYVQIALRVLLGLIMVFAGVGHLTFQRLEFQAQVPAWLPFDPDFVVLASGIVEIALGASMVALGRWKVWVGLALAAFYVAIFPGNIHQYTQQVDGFGLDTDQARLVRLFFQPLLVLWALWSSGALRALRERYAGTRPSKPEIL